MQPSSRRVTASVPLAFALYSMLMCWAAPCAAQGKLVRESAAAHYFLTMDGRACGYLKGAVAGGISADLQYGPRAGYYRPISAGKVTFEPVRIDVGFDLDKALYQAVADAWTGGRADLQVAVIRVDPQGKSVSEVRCAPAQVTAVTVPACDANSKDAGYLTVEFTPQMTAEGAASSVSQIPPYAPDPGKTWQQCNFALQIDGIDGSGVTKIDAFTVKGATAQSGGSAPDSRTNTRVAAGVLDFPTLKVTLTEWSAQDWKRWFDDAVVKGNKAAQGKTGRLLLLGPDRNRNKPLAAIVLYNVGIYGWAPFADAKESDAGGQVTVELNCDRMEFQTSGAALKRTNQDSNQDAQTASGNTGTAGTPQESVGTGDEAQGAPQPVNGDGRMRTPYVVGAGDDALTFALARAEYNASRVVLAGGTVVPSMNEKLLVLRYVVGNPTQRELTVNGRSFQIGAIDTEGIVHSFEGNDYAADEKTAQPIDAKLAPGVKLSAFTSLTLPNQARIVRLRVARPDAKPVLEIPFGPEDIGRLQRPFDDPADPSGALARKEVPADPTGYNPTGRFDIRLVNRKYETAALYAGGPAPDSGNRYLVVSVQARNAGRQQAHIGANTFNASAKTSDGERVKVYKIYKQSTAESPDTDAQPGDEYAFRIILEVSGTATEFSVWEGENGRRMTFRL